MRKGTSGGVRLEDTRGSVRIAPPQPPWETPLCPHSSSFLCPVPSVWWRIRTEGLTADNGCRQHRCILTGARLCHQVSTDSDARRPHVSVGQRRGPLSEGQWWGSRPGSGGQVAWQFPSSETLPMPSGLGCNCLLLWDSGMGSAAAPLACCVGGAGQRGNEACEVPAHRKHEKREPLLLLSLLFQLTKKVRSLVF